jgi:hypothetical protein
MDRDDRIIAAVNTYQVVTAELVCALLGMEDTHSNRNIVERRLRLLAEEDDRVKHFRQVRQDGVTYTVSLSLSLRVNGARAQLLHRAMQSRFWATLLKTVSVAVRKTDGELRTAKGSVIPDGFFMVHNDAFFVEVNTGRDSFDHPLHKAREYHRQHDYLCKTVITEKGQPPIESFRVLWVNRYRDRAAQMLRTFAEIGSGGLFLVTSQEHFNPFQPHTILDCWFSPKTGEKAPLLEG